MVTSKNSWLSLSLFWLLLLPGCARDNPNKVAIERWTRCRPLLLELDRELTSMEEADLPSLRDFTVLRKEGQALKSIAQLDIHEQMKLESCHIEGVRFIDDFRLYELHRFIRRASEFSATHEKILERHLMIIGSIDHFDFKNIVRLRGEKVIYEEQVNDTVKYLITQHY